MRTCPKCNLIIDNDSAKFCRKCGTKLPDIQPIESSEPEIIAEPEQEFHQAQEFQARIPDAYALFLH
jgi:RNA polymerase subunit RPABC4/transcription elongation factor Spt4